MKESDFSLLMVPGPSQPEPEVLSVLSMPVVPHYGKRWGELYHDTTSKLQRIFRTKNDVILVPTPGQLAVEMIVANLVPKGEEAFVCANGHFSEMMVEAVRFWGGKPIAIRSKPGMAITAEQVAQAIESRRNAKGRPFFIIHNETSTGVLNPVAEIFKVCRKHGMITVLDAISTFGGIDVRTDEWKADCAVGYSSKALGAAFGAQPVSVGPRIWEVAKKNKDRIHTRYLNLNVWARAIEKMGAWGHPHPSSMPTSVILALRRAAELALDEGLEKRYKRHSDVATFTQKGLEEMGLELFPERKYLSSTVSVPKVESKWDKELRSELASRYNIIVAAGLEELEGKIIRIGHMGTSATFPAVSMTLTAMKEILGRLRKQR